MSSTVLVTGASGLLGRAVFNTFQHSGVLVVGQGFSRAAPPTILKADLEKSEDIKTLLEEVKYDPSMRILMGHSANLVIPNARPQIVIHCEPLEMDNRTRPPS